MIHSFEPNPSLATTLDTTYANVDGIHVHQNALGAENTVVEFHVNTNDFTSSVLPSSEINHAHLGNGAEVEETIRVEQVRIDDQLTRAPDVVKLDLQGYELEALRGASEFLAEVQVVVTEISFIPLYEGQPLYCDIAAYLRENGFGLYNLYDLSTRLDGQLSAGDAVFVNTEDFNLTSFDRGN